MPTEPIWVPARDDPYTGGVEWRLMVDPYDHGDYIASEIRPHKRDEDRREQT